MHMTQSFQYLGCNIGCLDLIKFAHSADSMVKFTTHAFFCFNIKIAIIVVDCLGSQYIWVIYLLNNFHFSDETLNLLLIMSFKLHFLDCTLITQRFVSSPPDLSKLTGPENFLKCINLIDIFLVSKFTKLGKGSQVSLILLCILMAIIPNILVHLFFNCCITPTSSWLSIWLGLPCLSVRRLLYPVSLRLLISYVSLSSILS